MADVDDTERPDDITHAAIIVSNTGHTNGVKPRGFWCHRTESGCWQVYESRDEDELLDLLDPAHFGTAREVLRYLDRLEAIIGEDTDPQQPEPGVH